MGGEGRGGGRGERGGGEGRGGEERGGDTNTKINRVLTRKEPTNLDFRVFSANSIKCTLLCVYTKYIQFKVHLIQKLYYLVPFLYICV